MAEALAESIDTALILETAREPLPPFAYNVYIAHSLKDSLLVSGAEGSLCKILEKKKFKCLPRHVEDDNSFIKSRIDEGVWTSEKCLILMTDKYRDDSISHYEIQQIRDKAKRFSSDLVIVVWPRLREGDEFNIYTNIENIDNLESLCNSNENLSVLARSINKAPEASLIFLPKINTGSGAAFGFYYGFLSLVLPDFRNRFRKAALTDPKAEPGMLERSVCKMLIILPLSCFCSMEIPDTKGRIKNVNGLYVKRFVNRAGNVGQDIKSSVYKLVDETTQEEYYFAVELATPLLTMYESYLGVTGLTLPQLRMERDVFCFTLHQILNHPEHKDCNNQYRLIMWDDRMGEQGDYIKTPYELLLPILKEELNQERLEREHPSVFTSGDIVIKSVSHTTYEIVGENQQNMAAFYEKMQLDCYPLRNINRGEALIINIINFQASVDSTSRQLKKREGGQQDGDKMKELFEELGFQSKVYTDVNRKELESALMEYNSMDHSGFDAFICCIMTHGNLGEIYTRDGLAYRIINVVDFFSSIKCPSLRGKPKVFFFQSCQNFQSCQKGTEPERQNQPSSTDDDSSDTLTSKLKAVLVPGEPDVLVSYSALPGSASYRDTKRGALYIDALAANLRKDWDIDRALKAVTNDVASRLGGAKSQKVTQLPFHVTTGWSKLLYLTPVRNQ